MVKILFVFSVEVAKKIETPLETLDSLHEGISLISAVLKANHHQARLLVLGRNEEIANWRLVDKVVDDFQPKVIAFTAVATTYPYMAKVAYHIKEKHPDVYSIIGGPHVSLNPEEAITDGFDAVCIGEGEFPMLELVSQLSRGKIPANIPNLWIRRGDQIEKNSPRPWLQDLDSLPFSDRDIWLEWLSKKTHIRPTVTLGRGCPFQCSYCSNHALKKLAAGEYVRFRSPNLIVEEIESLLERWPNATTVYLEIENIGLGKGWVQELCTNLRALNSKRNTPVAFGCNLRITPTLKAEELFALFQESNITFVQIGLESGSERVRNEILRRRYSNEKVIQTVEIARKYGIQVILFNLIGVPGETYEDYLETVRINRICQPDAHFTSIYYPYPGTDLYEKCKREGLLNSEIADSAKERRVAILDLPGFSKKQIQKAYTWFEYNVYKGKKPLPKILLDVVFEKVPFLKTTHSIIYDGAYYGLRRVPFLRGLKKRFWD
ncbi:MAG: radical SAM protein [Pseudomonadota bacterium]